MQIDKVLTLTLDLPARPSFLHVATEFAGTSAAAYGLGKDECLKLGLAVEEIFMHLCKTIGPEQFLEIRSLNGVYYARIQFVFSADRFNLGGLNIASEISGLSGQDESGLEEMGLMLASRSVDHLNISLEKDGRICLSITKEKSYPAAVGPAAPDVKEDHRAGTEKAGADHDITVGISDPEHLKALAGAISAWKLPFVPPFFRYPGKVVDMVASGKYQAITALDRRKDIVGGALLRFLSDKIVEIYGPYVFEAADEATGKILEDCIGRIARTKALGLLSLSGLTSGVRDNFESLGRIKYYFTVGGSPIERPVFYRLLHEDPGFEVWTHGDFAPWLRSEYNRLVLARDIRIMQSMGETRSGSSLFAAEINREISEVILRPIWPGDDLESNVGRHVSFLLKKRFLNIFFEVDLGVPWQSELMPALALHGFKPRLLLPFAGKSDVIVFQYDSTES